MTQDADDTPESRRSPFRPFRWLVRGLLSLMFLGLVAASVVGIPYGIYLDQVVRAKFEGKRWMIPASVYGRSLDLYPGQSLSAQGLFQELERLGYRPMATPLTPGTFSRDKDRFLIRTRPFHFWDGDEPGKLLEVRCAAETLMEIREGGAKGGEVSLARLDPPLIGKIYPSHREDRVLLKRDELPEGLVKTLMAVEDRNFYHHHGVDPLSILRAFWYNLRAGSVVQGGSTLTQQLVKNFYLDSERTLIRKVNEAIMAVLLDRHYSKDEILEAYANEIYLGQDRSRAVHGFGLASQFYFARPLADLDIPRIALLVGLVKGPSHFDPRRHPERATQRRNLVIDVLKEQKFITHDEAMRFKAAPLGVGAPGGTPTGTYPGFLDLVRRQLHRDYQEDDLRGEGLRIFTTLDPGLQARVEAAIAAKLPLLEKQKRLEEDALEAAAVVLTTGTAEVLALVGDRDPNFAGFNRAVDAVRQIGSLIKPIVYLEALSQPDRYSLVTRLNDDPVSYRIEGGRTWSPTNYDHRSHGQVALYEALAHSYNQATVRLGLEMGVERIARTIEKLSGRTGIEAVPSLLLGATALTPLEVSQMYQVIAAGGFRSPVRAIREVLDAQGHPLSRYPLTVEKALDPAAVALIQYALREVIQSGTARAVVSRLPRIASQLAGKTGTTNELRDSWFAGFGPDRLAVVWVGQDDNQPAGLTGAQGALQIWMEIMQQYSPAPVSGDPVAEVETVLVDPASGLLAGPGCPGARQMPFYPGRAPQRQGCGSEAHHGALPDETTGIDRPSAGGSREDWQPPAQPAQPAQKRPSSSGGQKPAAGTRQGTEERRRPEELHPDYVKKAFDL
ncbi:Penicillin-insensitive transglycosylase / Penicillin-sensitive transpeptidase [Gammaproteobacteria bacterium]